VTRSAAPPLSVLSFFIFPAPPRPDVYCGADMFVICVSEIGGCGEESNKCAGTRVGEQTDERDRNES
jgi:hypothetical protein